MEDKGITDGQVCDITSFLKQFDDSFVKSCLVYKVVIPDRPASSEKPYRFSIDTRELQTLFYEMARYPDDKARIQRSVIINKLFEIKNCLQLLSQVPTITDGWQTQMVDYIQIAAALIGVSRFYGYSDIASNATNMISALSDWIKHSKRVSDKDKLYFDIIFPVFYELIKTHKYRQKEKDRVGHSRLLFRFQREILGNYAYDAFCKSNDTYVCAADFIYKLAVFMHDPRYVLIKNDISCFFKIVLANARTNKQLPEKLRKYFTLMVMPGLGGVIAEMYNLISSYTKENRDISEENINKMKVIIGSCQYSQQLQLTEIVSKVVDQTAELQTCIGEDNGAHISIFAALIECLGSCLRICNYTPPSSPRSGFFSADDVRESMSVSSSASDDKICSAASTSKTTSEDQNSNTAADAATMRYF